MYCQNMNGATRPLVGKSAPIRISTPDPPDGIMPVSNTSATSTAKMESTERSAADNASVNAAKPSVIR